MAEPAPDLAGIPDPRDDPAFEPDEPGWGEPGRAQDSDSPTTEAIVGVTASDAVHGDDDDADARVLPPPANPMAVARTIVAEQFTYGGTVVIRAWRGDCRAWDGRCWPERDEATIRAELYHFTESASYWTDKGELRPWRPTRTKIANVLEALRAVVHLSESVDPPAWLRGGSLDPRELLVLANGVLHLPTRELLPHDPQLFALHALPFGYDPAARPPTRWLAFLRDLWDDDDESIALAQEIFGYILGGDTSLQKIALLVGPPRAGKGVFANTLSAMVGRHNVGAPTLAGLTTNFGLQDLVGKTLAVVSDARLGSRTNVAALVERLLSISGQDAITIDRKYRAPWTGRLGVRFLLLTNELPRFNDASTALVKRFVVLILTRSFYGVEDTTLLGKIRPELPGILNWALDGLDRLRAQGRFTEPASAREAIRELEDLASPASAFLRDECVVGRDYEVLRDALWSAWKVWCDEQSVQHSTKEMFGRDLRAAIPGLWSRRPHVDGARQWVYCGVGLRGDDNNAQPPGPPGPPGPPRPTDDPASTSSRDRSGPSGPGGPGETPLFSRHRDDAASVEDDYPPSAWEVVP